MKNWYDDSPTFTELGHTIVVGRPAFVANFYSHDGLAQHATQILDAWLAMLPPKTPLYCSHERSKRFVKLTPKTLSKIRDEFSPARLLKNYQYHFIKSVPDDELDVDQCHAFSFEMYAASSYSGFVFVTFPRDYADTQGADTLVRWVGEWGTRFGFTHADAGLGYEVAWFDEQKQAVGPIMLTTGLRFHGVRVFERYTARFRERNATTLDTAAWLTYLNAEAQKRIGFEAVKRLDPGVLRHPFGTGLVLQAGPCPDPCDASRSGKAYALLKSVNDAIVPIRTAKWSVSGWGDRKNIERESHWLTRMDG